MKNKLIFIVITSIIACFILYFVERILAVPYEVKTICKIFLFTSIPLFYIFLFKYFKSKNEKKKSLTLSVILSISTFSIIWIGYFIFHQFVIFDIIGDELKLTEKEFLIRGLYIILGNSFLEEFFFRGYIFLNLYKAGFTKFSHIFSSLTFALYHIALFQTWFPIPIMLLVLLALFVVGFVFNYLVLRVASFKGSWIVHASADLAIILIGWIVLY